MKNAPLLFLAFVFLSLHLGIKGATCPSFNISYPPMRTLLCPGDNITYTCGLIGSTNNGATITTTWTGSGFPCQPTSLSNTVFIPLSGGPLTTTPGSCGNISAVTTNISGTCYTSVLTIPTPQYFNGTTVICSDGSGNRIGNDTLNIQLASSPGPVGNMTITSTSVDQLTVTWTPSTTGGVPTSYNVTINDSMNTQVSIQASGTLQYNFTNLIYNTLYTVTVVAINCAGSSNGPPLTTKTFPRSIDSTTINVQSVFNRDNTLRHIEITWTPVGGVVTMYEVYLDGGFSGNTTCTTPQCFYVVPVSVPSTSYVISVVSVTNDGNVGPRISTTIYGVATMNKVITKITPMTNGTMATVVCSMNDSYYCVVCCSTDPSMYVPPDSSVSSISTNNGTEVTVSLQDLTSNQTYYCKAAATNTSSNNCTGPVVGGVKVFFALSTTEVPTSSDDIARIVGGVVGGVGGATLLVVIVVVVVVVIWKKKRIIICICCISKKKGDKGESNKGDDTVEMGKSASHHALISDGTGGAMYQDPKAIDHVKAPRGDMYAMSDKPTKTSDKTTKKPTATITPAGGGGAMYQDPKDIQHTTTPAGETYAMTDKKPTKPVDHVKAPTGDMYAVADGNKQPKKKM